MLVLRSRSRVKLQSEAKCSSRRHRRAGGGHRAQAVRLSGVRTLQDLRQVLFAVCGCVPMETDVLPVCCVEFALPLKPVYAQCVSDQIIRRNVFISSMGATRCDLSLLQDTPEPCRQPADACRVRELHVYGPGWFTQEASSFSSLNPLQHSTRTETLR